MARKNEEYQDNDFVADEAEDTTEVPVPVVPAEPEAPEPIALTEVQPTTRIRIFRNYGGRPTNEQRLVPGVYRVEDLAKYMNGDLAAYLVANGHGEWV